MATRAQEAEGGLGRCAELVGRYAEIAETLASAGHVLPLPPLPVVAAAGNRSEQATRLAEAAARQAGVSARGQDTRELARQWESVFGVEIAAVDLPEGIDGVSWAADDFRLILVGRGAVWTRQRFTLAHELGHILAGDAAQGPLAEAVDPSRSTAGEEVGANTFAAELLMPRAEVARMFSGSVDEGELAWLAWEFRVSPSAMATRLKSLGLIGAEDHRRLCGLSTREAAFRLDRLREHLRLSENSGRGWAPQRLGLEATTAYLQGQVGARLPAAVLGIDVDAFLDAQERCGPEEDVPVGRPAELVFIP